MSGREAEVAIEAHYRAYIETFNRKDAAGVARLLAFPAMMGGTGHPPMRIPDATAYQRLIESTYQQFRAKGWVRSQIDGMEAVVTAGDTGVLAARFSRYREDGGIIEEGGGHYVMVRRDGEWRIIAAIVAE
jgi:hypothetical protein